MNFRYKCSRTTRMNVGTAFSSIPPSCRKVSSMEIQKRGTAEWLLNGSTYHNGGGVGQQRETLVCDGIWLVFGWTYPGGGSGDVLGGGCGVLTTLFFGGERRCGSCAWLWE